DLCSGPGAQALFCAGFARNVVAVEINPVSHALARLNIAMNGLETRITPMLGDLFEPVTGRRFDFISCNPPLIPFPNDVFYPFVGHGGPDGLQITRKILQTLPDYLTPGGRAQIIGTCLSDGARPLITNELETIAREFGLDMMLTVTAQLGLKPGSPMFESFLLSAVRDGDHDTSLRENLIAFLGRENATHFAAFYLLATIGRGRMSLLDLAKRSTGGALWYL